jgi:hypothetical protein
VLQIDANPSPGAVPSAHRIDEYVGGLQIRCSFGVTRFPALDAGQSVFFAPGARFDG